MDSRSLIEKHDGIYIIRQQMPYPLQENNAYLAETGNGWAVIDLGIDLPQTRELWAEAIKAAGLTFHSIKKIIVTHCHPDHLGAAAWMQQMTGAPVYMSEIDRDIASTYVFLKEDKYTQYEKAISSATLTCDFDVDKTRRLVVDWCDNVVPLFPEPWYIETLKEDDEIELNGNRYMVKILPGHTDGQAALWCRENRALFSGDIFAEKGYLHFTDWPHTVNANPLKDLFMSLDRIEEMDPATIYAGHGAPVHSYKEIFSKLRYRHKKLLGIFENSVKVPVSAGQVYEKFFPVPQTGDFADYIHYHRVLAGETAGYLNYLVSQDKFSLRREDGVDLYCPSGA